MENNVFSACFTVPFEDEQSMSNLHRVAFLASIKDDCSFDDNKNSYCHWRFIYPHRAWFARRSGPTSLVGTGPESGYDPTNSTYNGEN